VSAYVHLAWQGRIAHIIPCEGDTDNSQGNPTAEQDAIGARVVSAVDSGDIQPHYIEDETWKLPELMYGASIGSLTGDLDTAHRPNDYHDRPEVRLPFFGISH
jgi:hypothetical protein